MLRYWQADGSSRVGMESRRWCRNSRSVQSKYIQRVREREKKRRPEETYKAIHGLSDLFRFDYILGSTLPLPKIFPLLFTEIFLVSKNKGNQNVSAVHL